MTNEIVVLKNENGEPYIPLGDYVLRLEEEEIEGYFLKKAENELRETPDVVEQALEELRDLIRGKMCVFFLDNWGREFKRLILKYLFFFLCLQLRKVYTYLQMTRHSC